MMCHYQKDGAPCLVEIERDPNSYSGWRHIGGEVGWQHWASPEAYGSGKAETLRIFAPCEICGKKGPENREHMERPGHRFVAQERFRKTEMLQDCIAAHVRSGHHGLAITAMDGETVAGVDVYPDWLKDYKELPFADFAQRILEPCFASLVAHLEAGNKK